jgi:hypothetical protein
VKVSLHEPGPARYALTREWVQKTGYQASPGRDARLAEQWERPRPKFPNVVARPFTIIVPADEVIDRAYRESEDVTCVAAPPDAESIHFDVVYTPAGVVVDGYPGQRSMGALLVGQVALENGEQVFVTAIGRPLHENIKKHVRMLRSARIMIDGEPIDREAALAFGTEPNPDADDGTKIGIFLDVTRNPKSRH